MRKLPRLLAIIMALLITLSAVSVPVLAEDTVAKYPNTESFSWGVNGHVTYPAGDNIDAYMSLAAKMGAKLYRVDLHDIANLASADKIVQAANAYGLDVMLVLGGSGSTAEEVTSFYSRVANHYATGDFGTVKYIQIFNETETSALVEGDNVNPNYAKNYDATKLAANAERFKAAYNAVKAVSQDYITVVNYGWLHDPYLSLLADAGVQWDVTGINWYTDMEVAAENGLTTALNRLAADEALASKKVIITESNVWQGSTTITDDLSDIMATAYNSDMVIGMCFYELLDEPNHEFDVEKAYGLVNSTTDTAVGTVKEIYTSIQSLIGGSDAVVKGEFTPSAAYPDGTTTHTKAFAIDGTLTIPGTATVYDGSIAFGQSVDMFDYEAIEFDVYIESAGTDAVILNTLLQDSNWGSRSTGITVPVNQWVHQVVYVDTFINWGNNSADICRLGFNGIAAGNTVNIVNAAFVTGVNPEMKNKYNLAKEVNYEFHYTQSGDIAAAYTNKALGETVNFKSYDYLELDVKVDSNATGLEEEWFQIHLLNADGQKQLKDIVINTDEWVHIAIAPSEWSWGSGDISVVTSIQLDALNSGLTYHIANMTFTNFAIAADYTYNLGKELDSSLNYTGTDSWTTKTLMYMDEAVDITAYDYLEFDLYIDAGTTGMTTSINKLFYIDSTNMNDNSGRGEAWLTSETNKWVHYAIKTDSFDTGWGYNGNPKDVVSFMLDGLTAGATYHIANMALTNFEPAMNNTYTLGVDLDKGTSTGSHKGWPASAAFADGATDFTKYDYFEFDIHYTNSDTTVESKSVRIQFHNAGGYSFKDVTVYNNKWTHIVIPMAEIEAGYTAGNKAAVTAYGVQYESMADGEVYTHTNAALTNFEPAMNNTYNLAVDLDKGTSTGSHKGWPASAAFADGATDFTKYDYFEFDIHYTNSDTTVESKSVRIQFHNAGGYSFKDVTVYNNKWTHIVIPIAEIEAGYTAGNKAAVTAYGVQYESMADGEVYTHTNAALTNFEPAMNNTYYLGVDLDKGAVTSTHKGWPSSSTFADGATDFTKYDYFEFDIHYTTPDTSVESKTVRIQFFNDGGYSFKDVTVYNNKWTHIVIPMAEIDPTYFGGDKTAVTRYLVQFESMADGEVYTHTNAALTLAEEPVAVTWGDANGDGTVNIVDLVHMKKLMSYADGEYVYDDDAYICADFDEDGMIGAVDLVVLRKYLLGVITSLDPADLA